MLMASDLEEDLFMYLLVSDHAISAVLLRDQGVQHPVYYIRKTFRQRRDEIPASGEVGIGSSSRHQKVAPLLPGSYRVCID